MQYPVIIQSVATNSQLLQGFNWASPDNIGTVAPATGSFTTLNANTANLETVTLGSSNVSLANGQGYVNLNALDLTVKGSLITSNGTIAVSLVVGTNNQVLIANSTTSTGLEWSSSVNLSSVTANTLSGTTSVTGGVFVAGTGNVTLTSAFGRVLINALDLTTQGSLITSDGVTATVLTLGADGQILVANSTEPNGMEWVSAITLTTLNATTVNATTVHGSFFVAGTGNVTINNAAGNLLVSALDLAAKGSLITSDGASATVLSVGSDGQLLIADSTQTNGIRWTTTLSSLSVSGTATVGSLVAGSSSVAVTSATGFVNLSALGFTAKGDLATSNGTQGVRLPVGSDGQVLRANSAATNGIEWASFAVNWNNIGNPTANLSLAMGTFTTDFTWGDTNGFTLINSGSTTSVLTLRNTNTTASAPLLRINETSGNLLFRVVRSATDSTACALQFYNSTTGADLRTFMQQQITTNQFVFNTTARFRFVVNGTQVLDLQSNHLEANDGTVSLPAFSFFNETSTGFYRATTSTLSATIAGTERTRLTAKAFNITSGTHLCTSGTSPTATPQAALGTTGQSASLGAGSTDIAGTIQFTRGSGGTATGLAVRLNFATNFTSTPAAVLISAASANAANEVWYETNRSSTGFTIATNGTLANSTTYQVSYIVIGQTE